jgi:hypothetical protein
MPKRMYNHEDREGGRRFVRDFTENFKPSYAKYQWFKSSKLWHLYSYSVYYKRFMIHKEPPHRTYYGILDMADCGRGWSFPEWWKYPNGTVIPPEEEICKKCLRQYKSLYKVTRHYKKVDREKDTWYNQE